MTRSKAADTLTVSTVQPPRMVEIVKDSKPKGFGDRAMVPETGLDHWLDQGWKVAKQPKEKS